MITELDELLGIDEKEWTPMRHLDRLVESLMGERLDAFVRRMADAVVNDLQELEDIDRLAHHLSSHDMSRVIHLVSCAVDETEAPAPVRVIRF